MVSFSNSDVAKVSADPVALGLDDLRVACETAVADLKAARGWPDTDIRVQSIHRLRNILQGVLAMYTFRTVIFPAKSFWDAFFQCVPGESAFQDHHRELDVLVRFAAIQGMLSAYEADIRGIVRGIDRTACGGGNAAFQSVVSWLLARCDAANLVSLTELFRLLRNTIHNNGVYQPSNGGDEAITVDGVTYEFRVGAPVDFVGWTFVVSAGQRLVRLLRTVANDPFVAAVSSIPSE